MPVTLDPTRSSIRLRTFAEGLLARLAHDLELTCHNVSGTGDDRSAKLSVPIDGIEVAGTLKHGKVEPSGLSASDREDCLSKMRREVFHADGAGGAVEVEATLEDGRARVRITPPNGAVVERIIPLRPATEPDGTVRVTGSLDLSLSALGSDPVKGPMNAFRVKDRVEVLFDVVFQPA